MRLLALSTGESALYALFTCVDWANGKESDFHRIRRRKQLMTRFSQQLTLESPTTHILALSTLESAQDALSTSVDWAKSKGRDFPLIRPRKPPKTQFSPHST